MAVAQKKKQHKQRLSMRSPAARAHRLTKDGKLWRQREKNKTKQNRKKAAPRQTEGHWLQLWAHFQRQQAAEQQATRPRDTETHNSDWAAGTRTPTFNSTGVCARVQVMHSTTAAASAATQQFA